MAWLDGATAISPGAGQASGPLRLFPGSHLSATWSQAGVSLELGTTPWFPTVIVIVAGLLFARVWRLARRPAASA